MEAWHLTYRMVIILCGVFVLFGCDPLSRHKVVSTLFDGVPSMPPPEKFCSDYYEKRVIADAQKAKGIKEAQANDTRIKSTHAPYGEKKCDGCHDKTKPDGLIRPKDKLCLGCHKDFIKGPHVHGPVALAACLNCHVPHDSQFPSLLKLGFNETCAACHQEQRVASGLHKKSMAKQFTCIDCHDPHFGNDKFFLR